MREWYRTDSFELVKILMSTRPLSKPAEKWMTDNCSDIRIIDRAEILTIWPQEVKDFGRRENLTWLYRL